MGIIGVIWGVVIALKIFTTLITVGWFTVIFWPLIPIFVIFIGAIIVGALAAAFK